MRTRIFLVGLAASAALIWSLAGGLAVARGGGGGHGGGGGGGFHGGGFGGGGFHGGGFGGGGFHGGGFAGTRSFSSVPHTSFYSGNAFRGNNFAAGHNFNNFNAGHNWNGHNWNNGWYGRRGWYGGWGGWGWGGWGWGWPWYAGWWGGLGYPYYGDYYYPGYYAYSYPDYYTSDYYSTNEIPQAETAVAGYETAPDETTPTTAMEETSETANQWLDEAREAFQKGDYRNAARLAAHAAIDDPQDPKVHELASLALFAGGQYRARQWRHMRRSLLPLRPIGPHSMRTTMTSQRTNGN